MRALILLLALASCVVVHVEPVRVVREATGSATSDAGLNCLTSTVPSAPATCFDSRDNALPADPCATISIRSTSTGAIDWRCMTGLTIAPDGYDNMPGVGYVPLGEAGSTTP